MNGNTKDLAPVVLFVYNRPWHTEQTLLALKNNKLANQSTLYIIADGPKTDASKKDLQAIAETREIIKKQQWCKNVIFEEKDHNEGLANSIIKGVTKIVNKFGKIIVLEDDLLTSEWFLTFMNDGLTLYASYANIYSVNAFMFPITTTRAESVILPHSSTWGWGTWKECWSIFNYSNELNQLFDSNIYLKDRFNVGGYSYSTMLKNAKNSWGIHWYASIFKRNGLGVFPTQSLIKNIGFDGTGINCPPEEIKQNKHTNRITVKTEHNIDLSFYDKYLLYFSKLEPNSSPSIIHKLINIFKC